MAQFQTKKNLRRCHIEQMKSRRKEFSLFTFLFFVDLAEVFHDVLWRTVQQANIMDVMM
jgi:hypothetical protein